MKRSALALVLSLTAVFISGVAVGALSYRFYAAGTMTQAVQLPPAPDVYRDRYVEFLSRRLDLTEEQVTELRDIMDRTRQSMDELNEKTEPQMQAIMQQQFDDTMALLNEEQQAEFQEFLEERSSFRGRARGDRNDRRGERPPPPSGFERGAPPPDPDRSVPSTEDRRGRAPNPPEPPVPTPPVP